MATNPSNPVRNNPADVPAVTESGSAREKGADSAQLLRSAALQTSGAILAAQRRAEDEHLRIKETLERLQKEHQLILDSVGEGLHGISADGTIMFENPAAATMLGWDAQDMLGRHAHSLIHHTRADGVPYPVSECPIYATLQDGVGRHVEDDVFWRKDGTSFPVAYTSTPMRNDAGEIVGTVVAFRDLTDQKRDEERFRQVVEAAPNAFVMAGSTGLINLVNSQTVRLFGYSREELIGQPIEILVPERFRAAHPNHRQEYFRNPQTRAMGSGRDLFGRRKDGSEFPIEIGLNPIVTENGLMVLSAIVDITERKRAETELREAHHELELRVRERTAELASVNEYLRDAIKHKQLAEEVLVGDREILGKIAEGRPISEILETLTRNIEAQSSGTLCSILLLDADGVHLRHGAAPNLPEAYNRAIDGLAIGPSVGSCGTAAYLRKQVIVTDIATDPLWAPYSQLALGHGLRSCWSTPIQSAGGRVLGTFAIYTKEPCCPNQDDLATIDRATHLASIAIERKQDEAALNRAKEELEIKVVERTGQLQAATAQAQAADRIKSAFLAAMSHELRTPLNSIIGFTGIILQGLAGPLNPEQTKQLEMVRGSARHLLALINDVLDISKIEAGQLEVASEPFDVRASIVKVIDIVRPLAEKKGLALNVQLAADVGQAVGDQRRVEQILLNLLSNAIKFTERGQVALTADLVADFEPREGTTGQLAVCLRVSDTGMGIKPDDLATLFQPFRQLDSGLARNHEGTGLGLAICRRLADLMGGEITAESTWEKGSTFSVTLPFARRSSPTAAG